MNTTDRQGGFTLMELGVVIAITLIVTGVSLPTMTRAINNARLKSSANSIASIYQQARMRAARDDTYYEVIATRAAVQTTVCVDLNGDGVCQASEPLAVLPPQAIPIASAAVPVPLSPTELGNFNGTSIDGSTMYNQSNQNVPGIAFNSRGVPCQRASATSPCGGNIEWVQYLQWQNAGNGRYAAVTVSPTGRVRVWTYSNAGNGNGTWQ